MIDFEKYLIAEEGLGKFIIRKLEEKGEKQSEYLKKRKELLEEYNKIYCPSKLTSQDVMKEKNKQLKELSELINILTGLSRKFKNITFDFTDDGIKDYYNTIKRINPSNYTENDIKWLKGDDGIFVVALYFDGQSKAEYTKQMDTIFSKIGERSAGNIKDVYTTHEDEDGCEIKMFIECTEEFKKAMQSGEKRSDAPSFEKWLKSKGLKKYIKTNL